MKKAPLYTIFDKFGIQTLANLSTATNDDF